MSRLDDIEKEIHSLYKEIDKNRKLGNTPEVANLEGKVTILAAERMRLERLSKPSLLKQALYTTGAMATGTFIALYIIEWLR